MKITVRGWGRDMGETPIIDNNLFNFKHSEDGTVYRDTPVLYGISNGVRMSWFQSLRLTGNYRMDVQLSRDEVVRLFKYAFGSELELHDVKRYGLTFSPELVKHILKAVKLTDLTLGDLVAMSSASPDDQPETAEKLVEPTASNVRPFLRRI
jgi:hypothetical protein